LLHLIECEWTMNEGAASAILIHNDEGLASAAGATLEVMPLLMLDGDGHGKGMSVEVKDCVFEMNDVEFGAIANIGGTLSVDRTKFRENSGRGGDIVVTNNGSCSVQESCFDSSSSIAPGVIFIEEGSQMTKNMNNFGQDLTAGAYGEGGTCTHIFLEGEGADCLGSTTCTGNCAQFDAGVSACPADVASYSNTSDTGEGSDPPGSTPKGDEEIIFSSSSDGQNEGESGSSKLVPIAISAGVVAFIVLGMVGILIRRRKAVKRASGGDGLTAEPSSPGKGGKFNFLKRKKRKDAYDEAVRSSAVYDEELDAVYDEPVYDEELDLNHDSHNDLDRDVA